MTIKVKSPVTSDDSWAMTLPFVFNTGSHAALLFEDDIKEIEQIGGHLIPKLGQVDGSIANSNVTLTAVKLDMCLYVDGKPIHHWIEVQAAYIPGPKPEHLDRLSGSWIRHMVNLLTIPNNHQEMYCSNNMVRLANNVPVKYSYKAAQSPRTYALAEDKAAPCQDVKYPPLMEPLPSPPPSRSRHPWNDIQTLY